MTPEHADIAAPSSLPGDRTRRPVMDTVGLIVAALALAWALLLRVSLAPKFASMFVDFGSALPRLTEIWLAGWLPLVLGVAPAVLVGGGIAFRANSAVKASLLVTAILFTLASPVIFLLAMYLPIFTLADAIK